ncbi:glutamine synthetase family protein [Nitriliruptor alkaliphilus]|uniref:glutamine synthetase family protein n=1 Tax=Nitriliruptor alkaliphilus TaxID=427918 RepID=UPI0009F9CC0A|nr:glutamine synthetase family protein [Nitriliruptor alkaliphilus]
MAERRGMLTREELTTLVEAGDIDTVVVAFTDHYGRQMGKRFDAEFFVEEGIDAGTHACDYLLTVDMEMEPVEGYDYANWQLGYGDFHLVPDMDTLRIASWLDRTALVLCDVLDPRNHEPVPVAPRSLLRAQVERAAGHGYTAMAASELEYFLYQESFDAAERDGFSQLSPAGWYIEDYHLMQGTRQEPFTGALRRHLSRSGVPVENSKGEWGRGQHELNVRYTDALGMADRHTVYKQAAKDIALQTGCSVTFMAKPHESEAGSSCHLHVSLETDGVNAFAGDQALGPIQASDAFRWFLGGWMTHVADLMVFYAPTINSYKRYQDGSWAPTRIAWSHDNRTAGFRVVGAGPSLRIECRIPGADVNPYLAFAASLASGLDGIENRIEPPERFEGDVYQAGELPHVPKTLREATDRFAASDFVARTFGTDVREHYTHFFRIEQQAYDRAVTDWERRRYFERI